MNVPSREGADEQSRALEERELAARAAATLCQRRWRARKRGVDVPRGAYIAPLTRTGRPRKHQQAQAQHPRKAEGPEGQSGPVSETHPPQDGGL